MGAVDSDDGPEFENYFAITPLSSESHNFVLSSHACPESGFKAPWIIDSYPFFYGKEANYITGK